MTYIIILDIGTSNMLAGIYDGKGNSYFSASEEYNTEFIYPSMVEQDPLTWKKAAYAVLAKTAQYLYENNIAPAAIALTSQRASLIPVDRYGKPLRKAIMWQDKRTVAECDMLTSQISMQALYKKTGLRTNPYAVLPRIIWLKNNEKKIFDSSYKLIGVQDYVLHCLSGEFKTDWTQAARTMLMDINRFCWDEDLLGVAGLSEERLCTLVPPGSVAGHLTKEAAAQTGLTQGLPVILCGGDQQNAAVGLNVIRPGVAEANTGTGSFIIAHAESPAFDEHCRLLCSASAVAGKWITEASIFNSGAIFRWFKEQFYNKTDSFDLINDEAASSPIGSNGVLMLAHFEGSGAPYWEPKAKGMFFNLSLGTKRQDLCRAILEGISLEMLDNLLLFENMIGKLSSISIAGGLTKSNLFSQIQADVFNLPLVRYQNNEATSLGAVMVAMTALGVYAHIEDASSHILETQPKLFYPNEAYAKIYQNLLQRKRKLFFSLKESGSYDVFMPSVDE